MNAKLISVLLFFFSAATDRTADFTNSDIRNSMHVVSTKHGRIFSGPQQLFNRDCAQVHNVR